MTDIPQNRLNMTTEWLNSSLVRISVTGELDASNAEWFAEYVFRRAANCQRLIVDVEKLDFFALDGFSVLRTIDARCGHAAVTWSLVIGDAVWRVLRICDPLRTLPVEGA